MCFRSHLPYTNTFRHREVKFCLSCERKEEEKSCIRETLNISKCVASSRNGQKGSLTPTATATHPPHVNSPIMHRRLVHKDPKIETNFKTQKIIKTAMSQKSLEVCQY